MRLGSVTQNLVGKKPTTHSMGLAKLCHFIIETLPMDYTSVVIRYNQNPGRPHSLRFPVSADTVIRSAIHQYCVQAVSSTSWSLSSTSKSVVLSPLARASEAFSARYPAVLLIVLPVWQDFLPLLWMGDHHDCTGTTYQQCLRSTLMLEDRRHGC